jgi:hypothetical protein
MTASNPADDHRLLELYLDGQLTAADARQFAERLRTDPDLQRQWDLQQRIDACLRQRFPVATVTPRPMMAAPSPRAPHFGGTLLQGRRAAWAAAAALVVVAAALFWRERTPNAPHFVAAPLAQVYQRTLQQGFEPYYECDDPERFAEVFRHRQGRALELLPMPPGSRMLGLSYPGGLSRLTTAMLCLIDEQPVMVFVDRSDADQPQAAHEAAGLRIFREERDGLVLYEATPLDAPRALPYLQAR